MAQSVFHSCCRYAVRAEMAVHLADVLFRRTDLAARGMVTQPDVQWCASMMSEELGWTPQRRDAEIEQVQIEAERHFARIARVEARWPDGEARHYSRRSA